MTHLFRPILLFSVLALAACNDDDDSCYDEYLKNNSSLVCPAVYMPVCGCDGKTYGNGCDANSQGIAVVHNGPCK